MKPICPFMSDAATIRYCAGNCALRMNPINEMDDPECAIASMGWVAKNLLDIDYTHDLCVDILEQIKEKLHHEETENES